MARDGVAAVRAARSSNSKKRSPAHKAQDVQVMSTNSSSIVSKRSVEKLYYPREPHFFRFFVHKFMRRSPLINRGYHLRLHVIDVLVRRFLQGVGPDSSGKTKVVVNLGCGSDVLPWQCLSRYPEHCGRARFVDVDFPELIERKRQTVAATPELLAGLTGVRAQQQQRHPSVVFESDRYVQIGCDLRELATLQQALAAVLGDLAGCEFLFVAEVSITYMETAGADEVIRWASTLGDAEFVLLEQILPDGDGHPFATTMLQHFDKLNTPPKSVRAYPSVADQQHRFSSRGWSTAVRVWTLWQAWADDTFLSPADRAALDQVEPFDEWEELALFASHYCLVHAKVVSGGGSAAATEATPMPPPPSSASVPVQSVALQFDACAGQRGQRRFGTAMLLSSQDNSSSTSPVVLNVMGLGAKSRLQSCDVFGQAGHGDNNGALAAREFTLGEGGPASRMCHSLTDLGGGHGVLLAGGRAGPSSPFKDCWVFQQSASASGGAWKRTHDLPTPLHRHSVTALGATGMALLAGGRGEADALADCLLYRPQTGWVVCEILGHDRPATVYGAMLCALTGGETNPNARFSGVYAGGLRDGVVADQIFHWELDKPTIRYTIPRPAGALDEGCSRRLLARFGAACLPRASASSPGEFVVLGGVASAHLLDHQDEILVCRVTADEYEICSRLVGGQGMITTTTPPLPRPLLTGTSALLAPPDGRRAVVVGGGATCFSMGTFWNKGVYTIDLGAPLCSSGVVVDGVPEEDAPPRWAHEKTLDIIPGSGSEQRAAAQDTASSSASGGPSPTVTAIARVTLETPDDFARVLRDGRPVVLTGLDLGACVSTWSLDYLANKIGHDRKVVVHEATTQAMDFAAKNFRYATAGFGEFARRVAHGERLYLRALSHDRPAEKPAALADDFPALAPDFALPPQLSAVADSLFSSVLRVSGPVNMWLHYDVMANVYCQIAGSKRLMLFPPGDVEHLSFPPGASSSSIDVFASLQSSSDSSTTTTTTALSQTHPHEAVLSPGDVLYLPPLWLHTATTVVSSSGGGETSIAVNIFFRDLDGGAYAPGRDVYGNRDLAAYEKGRQDIARVVASFQRLPPAARQFYLLRLADELRRKAQ
ncbi:hypothetical protein B0T26DRAFT_743819 [Lasiosphaeria miniovina]|uniref:tRNA wybutosine-synthesizing protein 4 n=1 Tax=Lasiosphaeria miniovina TaxID=1954250 RepID=A0AA39ZZU1_9PEZI|nr:uncharacterized protein B0T26DRAFT_743819 [Lasiosphaeria miniovina]KAK0706605.1 hypothetical protein B0T26DRAFT_743819 [Lasiosphaeria miniovina]